MYFEWEEYGRGYVIVGKPEGKRLLLIPRCRRLDNIKIDLIEAGCGGVDWIGLIQERYKWRALFYSVMNFRPP
jgi:hypothetical protein